MKNTFITHSDQETKDLGKKIAQKIISGGVIALKGDLGAGKTTFVQGFATGLSIMEKIISPTFILIRRYQYKKGYFNHIDLYRLEKIIDLQQLGLEEIFSDPQQLSLIEWPEKLGKLLPPLTILVDFQIIDPQTRQIKISYP